MNLKQTSQQVTIIGALIICMVKFLVRPFVHIPLFWKPFIGIAPNLIGSFLLPFGACWLFERVFRLQTLQQVKLTCVFGLMLVVVNEFLQLIPVFGRTFDVLDIFSSFIGVTIGYFSFASLLGKEAQWRTYP